MLYENKENVNKENVEVRGKKLQRAQHLSGRKRGPPGARALSAVALSSSASASTASSRNSHFLLTVAAKSLTQANINTQLLYFIWSIIIASVTLIEKRLA